MPKINEVFLRALFSGYIELLIQNKEIDIEDNLRSVGYDLGKRIIMLYSFEKEKEKDIYFLLYKITFTYLNIFKDNSKRMIEKKILENNEVSEKIFLITDEFLSFSHYIKLPPQHKAIASDSMMVVLIQANLKASGVNSSISTHNLQDGGKYTFFL